MGRVACLTGDFIRRIAWMRQDAVIFCTAIIFTPSLFVALDISPAAEFGPVGLESTHLVEHYHPLVPGSRWTYRVDEGPRSYEQDIELLVGPAPGMYILATSSPNRRSQYLISNQEGIIVLHEIKARLSIIPVWRTLRFDPPLPYLNLVRGLDACWTWEGKASGFGPDVEQIHYTMQPLNDGQDAPYESMLEVVAVSETRTETVARYRALYAEQIGLIRVDGDDYSKLLLRHEIP
jgi:hypothetical protein